MPRGTVGLTWNTDSWRPKISDLVLPWKSSEGCWGNSTFVFVRVHVCLTRESGVLIISWCPTPTTHHHYSAAPSTLIQGLFGTYPSLMALEPGFGSGGVGRRRIQPKMLIRSRQRLQKPSLTSIRLPGFGRRWGRSQRSCSISPHTVKFNYWEHKSLSEPTRLPASRTNKKINSFFIP